MECTTIHLAAAVRDAAGVDDHPGAVAVRGGRILAVGARDTVERIAGDECRHVDHGGAVLLPAFVNAHAHLDLSQLARRPFTGAFADWAGDVLRERPKTESAIRDAVELGLRRSLRHGVGWLADIAGSADAVAARLAADPELRVPGISFLETFGIGRAAPAAAEAATRAVVALRALAKNDDVRVGLQPHAPYSCGRPVYDAAAELGLASTHLAETREEFEFVARASGPLAELLRHLGKWDETIAGSGIGPVATFADLWSRSSFVLAHCNHLDDDDVATLASSRAAVAYCPVASDYFGHRDHRYRELLEAGVTVALGTDGALCQPADEPQPFGILAQVRHLLNRDGTDPALLLAMATVHGAAALQLEPGAATFAPGAPARLVTIPLPAGDGDPLGRALAADGLIAPVA